MCENGCFLDVLYPIDNNVGGGIGAVGGGRGGLGWLVLGVKKKMIFICGLMLGRLLYLGHTVRSNLVLIMLSDERQGAWGSGSDDESDVEKNLILMLKKLNVKFN